MRRLLILAAILGLAALVAGCGGDEPVAPTSPAEEAAAAADGDSGTEAEPEPEPPAPIGSFTEGGRMTDARMDHVTVLLGDGRILTAGGRGRGATIRPPGWSGPRSTIRGLESGPRWVRCPPSARCSAGSP